MLVLARLGNFNASNTILAKCYLLISVSENSSQALIAIEVEAKPSVGSGQRHFIFSIQRYSIEAFAVFVSNHLLSIYVNIAENA
jgi:hypothetical protein